MEDDDDSPSAMMNDDDSTIENDDDNDMMGSSGSAMTDNNDIVKDPHMRIVDVLVTDWSFTPAMVMAKQGENVSLRLKGDKGIHSLLVADLGMNTRVEPDQETLVDIPTDKAGSFAGRCSVPCGPGHRDMTFTIVVE